MRWQTKTLWTALAALSLSLTGCADPEPAVVGTAPAANTADVNTTATNAPAANTPAANTPAANTPAANTPGGNTPAANTPGGNAPVATTGGKSVPVTIETSMGTIQAELYSDKAPISVKNFVSYAKKGHYNGTIFHRVIPDFMIQGGGFTADMTEKPTGAPIQNEGGNGLKNERGTLAMARTSEPHSATSQFFINVKDNDFLNRDQSQDGVGYAVFGKVTQGMDVVDKIRVVPTGMQAGMGDVPVQPVTIKAIRVK